MELNENLYSDNYETFDEWLQLVLNKERVYPQFRIPYDEWLKEYISDIQIKNVDEVKDLLRCLLSPINRRIDHDNYDAYIIMKESEDIEVRNLADSIYFNEMYKRIEADYAAWEGITWVLELLPYSPYQAITALEGYAYAQNGLPDDRIIGVEQCVQIILAKFVNLGKSNKSIFDLKPIEFEWLIDELYQKIGYDTEWTPPTRDGGKDIIASVKRPDGTEYVYIECKLYKTSKLTPLHVRSFAQIVNDDKINRGVIFCTGYANEALKGIDKRITILTLENICVLLNAHLGSDWEDRLELIINNKRRQYKK